MGVTSTTQTLTNPTFKYEPLRAASAGVYASVELTEWLGVQAEAGYVKKGGRIDRIYEMRLAYLETPVMLRLATPFAIRGARAFGVLGAASSVELNCSGYTTPPSIQSVNPPGTLDLDCDGQRKHRTDRGDVIGGGLSLDRGGRRVTLELRRTRGRDISGYNCCELRNDVTSIVVGVAGRLSLRPGRLSSR